MNSELRFGSVPASPLLGACLCVAWVCGVEPPKATAQLAITEVMASASDDSQKRERPDFWELTNFGANAIDLSGYRWGDDELRFHNGQVLPLPSGETTISPGESIIFVRYKSSVPDATAFAKWWGPELPARTRIYFWDDPNAPFPRPKGIDGDGDGAVRLWAPDGQLLDEARFGTARTGISFTYATASGDFTELSTIGIAGAFRAEHGSDIGSPGIAAKGPVPLRIVRQPASQSVHAGTEAVLTIGALGRPRPRIQWYFNDQPVQSAGEPADSVPTMVCYAGCGPRWRRSPEPADLVLPNIQPTNAGRYFAQVFNGLDAQTSDEVTLRVNSSAAPVQLECPPADTCEVGIEGRPWHGLVVTAGQTAVFTVRTQGFPLPAFQWSHSADGVSFDDLPGETNADLIISNIQPSHGGHYRVQVRNTINQTNFITRLDVAPPARLRITEAMSSACGGLSRDWWELTNVGTEPVNLCGYRWDDNTFDIGSGATISAAIVLEPGESLILTESQTPESFWQWWGESNLPVGQQFVNYAANGLSSDGDNLYLWNPTETPETAPRNYIDQVTFGKVTLPGASFWFDLEVCPGCPECGWHSVEGQCGVLRAAEGCDIGSPGWTRWTPPQLVSARWNGSGVALTWRAQPGSVNRLQFARRIAPSPVWEDLGVYQSAQVTGSTIDSTIGTDPQRYYRIVRVAPAECVCPEPDWQP